MFCTACGAKAPVQAKFCGACGALLLGPAPAGLLEDDAPSSAGVKLKSGAITSLPTWRCPACKQLNRPGNPVCTCGHHYAPVQQKPEATAPTTAPVENPKAPLGTAPFFSIWGSPRATIRRIVETDPTKHVAGLAMVSGFLGSVNVAASRGWGDNLTTAGALLLAVGTILRCAR